MNKKSIIGFAVGPLSSAVLGLILVPYIAWNFNPVDIGRLNVFQVTLSFVLLLCVLGLDQAYVREYHETKDRQQLLIACFLPGLYLLAIISLPTVYFADYLSRILYESDDGTLYLITLIAFFVSHVSRFLSLILRMEERGWAYSASQIFPKLNQILMVGFLVYYGHKKEFLQLQLIVLVSMASVMFFYAWYSRKNWVVAFKKKLILLS